MNTFRTLDKIVQALKIRVIVDRLAILFNAAHLLIESADQLKQSNSSSKLDCFRFFHELHLKNSPAIYNKNYLDLIYQIIGRN